MQHYININIKKLLKLVTVLSSFKFMKTKSLSKLEKKQDFNNLFDFPCISTFKQIINRSKR